MTRDQLEAEYQAALQAYREAAKRLSAAKKAANPGPVRKEDRVDVIHELVKRGMPVPDAARLVGMTPATAEWYLSLLHPD